MDNKCDYVRARGRVLGRGHNAGSRSGGITQFSLLFFPRFLQVVHTYVNKCVFIPVRLFGPENAIRPARRFIRIISFSLNRYVCRSFVEKKKKLPNFHLRPPPPDRSSVVVSPPLTKRVYNCTVFAYARARGVDGPQREGADNRRENALISPVHSIHVKRTRPKPFVFRITRFRITIIIVIIVVHAMV